MGSHESKREAFLVISDPGMNSRGPGMPTSILPVHEIKYTSDLFYPLLLWVSVITYEPILTDKEKTAPDCPGNRKRTRLSKI